MTIRAAFLIALLATVHGVSRAEEGAPTPASSAVPTAAIKSGNPLPYRRGSFAGGMPTYKEIDRDRTSRAWKISLAPLLASQALDTASSYGMRELNPALANSNGQFGMKSASIKFGAIGALIGVEYLIVRRHPKAANAFAKLNWATSAVTSGFAVHNFMIR